MNITKEPRKGYSMPMTEELRRMLDERGVEWAEGIARPELTQVRVDGKVIKFHPWQPNTLKVSLFDITPEQAIAAMLGSCNCTNDCANGERMDVPCLPHFWTHDGTLHIEATRMPTRIVVCEGGTCEFVPKRELDASEAENAKLREQIHWLKKGDILHVLTDQEFAEQQKHEREMQASIKALDDENAKLRELVRDMWNEGMCECGSRGKCARCEYDYPDRMSELGVEADE